MQGGVEQEARRYSEHDMLRDKRGSRLRSEEKCSS